MDHLMKKALLLVMISFLLLPTACQKKTTPTITVTPYPLAPENPVEQTENKEKRNLSEVYSKEMFFKEKYYEVGYFKPIGIHENFFEYYYWGDLYRLNLDDYTEEIKPGALQDFWYEKYDSSNILSDNQAYYYIELTEDGSQNELLHMNLICKNRQNLTNIWKINLYTGEYFGYIHRLVENESTLFVSVSQTYQIFCINKKDGSIQWVFEPAKTDKNVVYRDGSDCMADIGNKSISCEFVHEDGLIVHLSSVDQQDSLNIYNQYYLVSFDGKLLNTFNEEPITYFEDTYFYQDKRYFGYKKILNNQIVWRKLRPSKEETGFSPIKDYMVRINEIPQGLMVTFLSARNGSIAWRKIIPSTNRYTIQELYGNYYILFQDRNYQNIYRIMKWNTHTKQEKWIKFTNQIEKKHSPRDDWTLMPSFNEYFVNDINIVSSLGNVYMLTRLGLISLHDQATYTPYKTDTVTYKYSLYSNQTTFVLCYTVSGQGMVPGGKILVLKDTPEEEPSETKEKEEIEETIPELFLSWFRGTGGRQYLIYQITKDGYRYLQNIFIYSLEVLDENHNDYQDIKVFARLGAGPGGTTNGLLHRFEFNGEYYISKKSMEITEEHASRANLFHPEENNREEHPRDEILHWSPKDDDLYRK